MLSESIVALILAASTQLVAAQNPQEPVNGETGGSLSVNPTVANADITVRGTDWLWAAFAIMLASGIGVLAWGLSRPVGTRAFHYIGVFILFTASFAYFSMASDLGSTPVYVEFVRYRGNLFTNEAINPYTRSIWYVRYIDWVITTPLLLLELLLATGLPTGDIVLIIFFDLIMIIGGLVGSLVPTSYKWGYFTGACVAEIFITYQLIFPARKSAKGLGTQAYKAYTTSALILSVLWFLYPIAWGLADGGNVITPDSEMIFYGVLDVIAKPVFLIYHLFSLRSVPYESFQLQSGHYSAYAHVPGAAAQSYHGPVTAEKRAPGAHSVPAGNVGGDAHAHGAPGTGTYPGQVHVAGSPDRTSNVTAV